MPTAPDSRIRAAMIGLAAGWLLQCATAAPAVDAIDVRPRNVERIPPGTVVGRHHEGTWNRLVLLARPRLAAGDVERVSRTVRDYATRFPVVVMARVEQEAGSSPGRFRLGGVGLGYCTSILGEDVVISTDTHERLGARLDLIGKIVLGQNEKCLDDARIIASSDTLMIFDVRAIVLREDMHRDMVVRHMVWVSSPSGKVAALIWLLDEDAQVGYRLAEDVLHAIAQDHVEDRVIHVLASEFTLGVPSARAFALIRMPQGKVIQASPDLARLAVLPRYTEESLREFVDRLRTAF